MRALHCYHQLLCLCWPAAMLMPACTHSTTECARQTWCAEWLPAAHLQPLTPWGKPSAPPSTCPPTTWAAFLCACAPRALARQTRHALTHHRTSSQGKPHAPCAATFGVVSLSRLMLRV